MKTVSWVCGCFDSGEEDLAVVVCRVGLLGGQEFRVLEYLCDGDHRAMREAAMATLQALVFDLEPAEDIDPGSGFAPIVYDHTHLGRPDGVERAIYEHARHLRPGQMLRNLAGVWRWMASSDN